MEELLFGVLFLAFGFALLGGVYHEENSLRNRAHFNHLVWRFGHMPSTKAQRVGAESGGSV